MSSWPETQRERDALDRHITGNYGEDQFSDEGERPDICGEPFDSTPEGDTYCLNAFPCKDHPVVGK